MCIYERCVVLIVFLPVYAVDITALETSTTKTKDEKIYSNAIDFIERDDGFKIKLHNYDLYLTAASSANGANVYWGAASTSTYQLWSLVSA